MDYREDTIQRDDAALHVRIWEAERHPIILLHGLASSSHIWDLVASALAPRFRVIAPDQRGHGESDKPESGYDLATFVEDLRGVIEALALDRPTIVGHSWGGNVALEYAVRYPDKLSRLVLVDGGFTEFQLSDDGAGMSWEVAEKQLAPPDITMPLPAFIERIRARLGGLYSEAVRDAILGNVWIDQRGVIHPHLTRERHMLILRALWEHRPSQIYERVRVPTLVIPALSSDILANPDRLRRKRRSVALAEQRLPRSRVIWMNDTIHDIPLQRPVELANAIAHFVEFE